MTWHPKVQFSRKRLSECASQELLIHIQPFYWCCGLKRRKNRKNEQGMDDFWGRREVSSPAELKTPLKEKRIPSNQSGAICNDIFNTLLFILSWWSPPPPMWWNINVEKMVTLLKDLALYLVLHIDFHHCGTINHSQQNPTNSTVLQADQEVHFPPSGWFQGFSFFLKETVLFLETSGCFFLPSKPGERC